MVARVVSWIQTASEQLTSNSVRRPNILHFYHCTNDIFHKNQEISLLTTNSYSQEEFLVRDTLLTYNPWEHDSYFTIHTTIGYLQHITLCLPPLSHSPLLPPPRPSREKKYLKVSPTLGYFNRHLSPNIARGEWGDATDSTVSCATVTYPPPARLSS